MTTPNDLSTATIEFIDDPEPNNTPKTVAKLESVIRLARTRTRITQQRDDEMASSIDFLKKVRRCRLDSRADDIGGGSLVGRRSGTWAIRRRRRRIWRDR